MKKVNRFNQSAKRKDKHNSEVKLLRIILFYLLYEHENK